MKLHALGLEAPGRGATSLELVITTPVPIDQESSGGNDVEDCRDAGAACITALAQDKVVDPAALKDCPPIGQSAKGELIYGMDCAALKPENRLEAMPNMPPTNLKDTAIPNSGGVDNPKDTPTKGEPR